MNEEVVPENLFEENEIAVNGIYLQTWLMGRYEFTIEQTDALINIAYNDAASHGPSVYDARALLKLDQDDNLVHPEERIETKKKESSTDTDKNVSFAIYPNPNNGRINISYSLSEGEKGELIIFDLLGREVEQKNLIFEGKILEIDLHKLNVGMYFYEYFVNGMNLNSGKLVIIR